MGRTKINHYTIPNDLDQVVRIQKMLTTLELNMASNSLEAVEKLVREQNGTYMDLIETLVEKEFVNREQARIERWTKNAKFPFHKSIESFDFSREPDLDPVLIKELSSCRFIKKGQNVVFFGPPGVGKTHLSVALGREAIAQGFEARFITLDALIEQVVRLDAQGLSRLLAVLTRLPLLIIDDIDYDEPPKIVSLFLFKVIFRRDENGVSTIYTSNKPFREWEPLFSGDKTKAAAAIDRIHNNDSYILRLSGDSYRLKHK